MRSPAPAASLLSLLLCATALAADPAPADPAAADPSTPPAPGAPPVAAEPPPLEPAAAPAPSPYPDAPGWFKAGGCDVTLDMPATGKVTVPPATGTCDWTGKGKATLPKDGTPPAAPCHLYFKSSNGFIIGELVADKTCPSSYAAASRAFVRTQAWADGMYHVALTYAAE